MPVDDCTLFIDPCIPLLAPSLAPHDPNWQDAAARLQAPESSALAQALTVRATYFTFNIFRQPVRHWGWWHW
ncbi:hypothetical protein ACNKHM_09835 [Shigella sonnei]